MHLRFLRGAEQRAHPHTLHGGVPDRHLRQSRAQGVGGVLYLFLGNQDAADCGAFLTRFRGHLACDLLDEQVELRGAGTDRFAENAAIQRVGFLIEGNAPGDDVRVRLEHAPGLGRAGERHHVLFGEMIEDIARAAADQLQRALRQQFRGDDLAHHRFGQVGRAGGRLDHRGHPGDQAGSDLLQHPPAGEVERIDVQGHAALRRKDMPGREGVLGGKPFRTALHDERLVRKLPPGDAGEAEQRTDPALDIDPAVRLGCACECRNAVELVLALEQVFGQRFQSQGALMNSHDA